MDDLEDLGDKELIHSALRGDVEIVTRYGEEHPEAWAGLWFDNEPAVRIVAAFTGDLARHEAALRPRLGYPGRLVVRGLPRSAAEVKRVRQEIGHTLRQRAEETGRPVVTSLGDGKGAVRVTLRADQENLAAELAARYGDAVELRVGAFGYPLRRRDVPGRPGRPEPEERAIEGLELAVEAGRRVLGAGDDGGARLVLRNNGPERIGPLRTGRPLVGSLLDDSGETAGGHTGAIAGTGRTIDLQPGESAGLDVIYGTASKREELGYVLPPGKYWLRVRMRFRYEPRGPEYALTAPLTEITVVQPSG